jgi:hypothetical protein
MVNQCKLLSKNKTNSGQLREKAVELRVREELIDYK